MLRLSEHARGRQQWALVEALLEEQSSQAPEACAARVPLAAWRAQRADWHRDRPAMRRALRSVFDCHLSASGLRLLMEAVRDGATIEEQAVMRETLLRLSKDRALPPGRKAILQALDGRRLLPLNRTLALRQLRAAYEKARRLPRGGRGRVLGPLAGRLPVAQRGTGR